MKPGRNDLCDCGSKKKYKKCCFIKEQSTDHELTRMRITKMHEQLVSKLLDFTMEHYKREAIEDAWSEFHYALEEVPSLDFKNPIVQMFFPWFHYRWLPDADSDYVTNRDLLDYSIAEALMKFQPNRINDFEREYMKACCGQPYSFFETLDVVRGRSITVKDVLTDDVFEAQEKSGSESMFKGAITLGKIIQVQGAHVFDGLAPYLLPAVSKIEVLHLREGMEKVFGRLSRDQLFDCENEIIDYFWTLYDVYLSSKPKVLQNTDGELLVPHTLTYEIENTNHVFQALASLALDTTSEELLDEAEKDATGNIQSLSFPWLKAGNKSFKSLETTIFGHIDLFAKKMVVSVNSKERAEEIEEIIKERVPTGCKLKSKVVNPIEAALEERSKMGSPRDRQKNEELMSRPEVKAHLSEMMRKHWESWLNSPVPALGNVSPKEASQTARGKEMLEALLKHMEHMAEAHPMVGQDAQTFQDLRNQLGML